MMGDRRVVGYEGGWYSDISLTKLFERYGMTTIWDYRPEVAAAVADGSLGIGLSEDALASIRHNQEQALVLLTPLTQVESLAKAEALCAKVEGEYFQLIELWAQTLRESGIDPAKFGLMAYGRTIATERMLVENESDPQRWQGILDSEVAFMDWIARHLASDRTTPQFQRNDELAGEATLPYVRYSLAKHAIAVAFAITPTPSTQTVSVLIDLADLYMTQIEDIFLAAAEYDDDGERISLAEVRADLGL